jgi:hypothetical protein
VSFNFKYILIAQGDFTLVFHTCIYRTLIRLTPSITFSLSHCSPIIQQLSMHFVIPSSYTDAMYFNIIHSLSFSFPLPSPHSLLIQIHDYNHVFLIDR